MWLLQALRPPWKGLNKAVLLNCLTWTGSNYPLFINLTPGRNTNYMNAMKCSRLRHLLHKRFIFFPVLYKWPFRPRCHVSRPITTDNCCLLMFSSLLALPCWGPSIRDLDSNNDVPSYWKLRNFTISGKLSERDIGTSTLITWVVKQLVIGADMQRNQLLKYVSPGKVTNKSITSNDDYFPWIKQSWINTWTRCYLYNAGALCVQAISISYRQSLTSPCVK